MFIVADLVSLKRNRCFLLAVYCAFKLNIFLQNENPIYMKTIISRREPDKTENECVLPHIIFRSISARKYYYQFW